MARTRNNGNGKLDEALQNMLLAQTALAQQHTAFLTHIADNDRRHAENERLFAEVQRDASARFARIEAILLEHTRMLEDHHRMLEALPDLLRDRFGFRAP